MFSTPIILNILRIILEIVYQYKIKICSHHLHHKNNKIIKVSIFSIEVFGGVCQYF